MTTTRVNTMSTHQPVVAYKTSIGMKFLMAITGFMFIGFVTGHLLGNLQIFLGAEKLNAYAHALQSLGGLLWVIRSGLAAFFAVHIFFAIKLWFQNRASRPVSYVKEKNVESTTSSRTMIWSGATLFLFVIYHLLHFTAVVTNPEYAQFKDAGNVYTMMIMGFENYYIVAVYSVAMISLAFHVNHAVWSMFQTFGLTTASWIRRLRFVSTLYAFLILFGYLSIPAGVLFGIIERSQGGIH